MKPTRLFQPVLACLTACVALAQQGAQPAAPPADEEDVPEVEEEWDFSKGRGSDPVLIEKLNRMLPAGGKPHEGLRCPVYNKRAGGARAREAHFESKRVTRKDETHILFEEAVYQSFGNPKTPDAPTQTVTLKDATYNLEYNLVSSHSPIAVEDQDFRIECGGVLRDLTTGLTVYTGGAKLYLDESGNESPAAPQPVPVSGNPEPKPPVSGNPR